MVKTYGQTVGRNVSVTLGVIAVLAAIYLAAVGVSYLVHSQHDHGPVKVVVTTSR